MNRMCVSSWGNRRGLLRETHSQERTEGDSDITRKWEGRLVNWGLDVCWWTPEASDKFNITIRIQSLGVSPEGQVAGTADVATPLFLSPYLSYSIRIHIQLSSFLRAVSIREKRKTPPKIFPVVSKCHVTRVTWNNCTLAKKKTSVNMKIETKWKWYLW